MAERYQHIELDKKWQDFWSSEKLFEADNNSTKEKFYCLIEFPYPSGAGLHVGHCRSYTALDTIARKKRMQNFEVLFPLGWDAFGLPTENFAIKNKIRPQDATAANIANFKRQCQSVGFSFDWSREIDTTDPSYFKWTQWIFLQMFKKGLAEQKVVPINWCPECKIGLANEEVIDGKHERCGTQVVQRDLKQWILKITEYADRLSEDLNDTEYLPHIKTMQKNWIGKSRGAEITFNTDKNTTLTVYTTRPDTLEGATYMVISPEHKDIDTLTTDEHKDAVANYQEEAKKKSELERTQLDKKKTGVFTGSYATNPINGESLPIWTSDYVLATYGTGAIMAVPHLDERDAEFAQTFDIPAKEIEPDDSILAKIIEQGVAEEKINFKLHDWNFSRQRYWGEPIPLVHCEDCGVVPVPEDQLPLELPYVENYEPTDDATSPLSRIEEWVNTPCPKCGKPAKRETDTMPQWAGSSWYFLRYTDPHNDNELASKEALQKWMNVDLYNGGMEHVTLHLLYSRFWHKFLYDIEAVPTKEPYTKRINHGMILGPDGEKMSKSRGNVINPDDVVNEFGADTLRVYELFIGPYDQVVAWSTNGVEGVSKFLQKVWRLQEKIADTEIPAEIDALLHKTIKKVDEDIENRNFNTAVSALMILNNAFQKQETVPRSAYEKFLTILTPLAPHIAEEIWVNLGNTESIHLQSWPEVDESKLIEDTVQVMIAINGKVRSSLQISPDEEEEKAIDLALADEAAQKHFEGKEIMKKIYVPGKMINIVVK